MRGTLLTTLLCLAAALSPAFCEDGDRHDMDAIGATIRPAAADPAIASALGEISPAEIQKSVEKLVSFHNRNTISSVEAALPAGQGVTASADWIESQFKSYAAACGGCLEVRRDTFTEQPEPPPQGRIPKATTITNIYAVLKGSDPAQAARMLLVTGHYDSRNSDTFNVRDEAPGANDDASGVAVSLECARVLSGAWKNGLKLPATLVFAAVAGEEQGLNGSRHLAQLAKSRGWQLEAVLNNDIVGGNTTPGERLQDKSAVRVFSEGLPVNATSEEIKRIAGLGLENDSPSRELARAIQEIGATYPGASGKTPFEPVLIFRRDRYLRGGDHTSFNQLDFAAVRFTEWREDFDHQHQDVRLEKGVQMGDLLKFVDFSYVANVARVNAAGLATLAAAPPPPQNVRIVTRELDNNTTLHWVDAPGAPAGASYEVVWRPTFAPQWQRSIVAPPGQSAQAHAITLPVSKDNVIFGVRAVDGAGHRSVAVTPLPER